MIELDVKSCANGNRITAMFDPTDNSIVIFSRSGEALGYIVLNDAILLPPSIIAATSQLEDFAEYCRSISKLEARR